MPDVRWGAFAGAAILAPVLPALPALPIAALLAQTPAMAVPATVLFAVALGAPTYLLFGLPAFYLTVRRFGGRRYWLAAAAANLVSAPFVFACLALYSREPAAGTAFIVGFGCIFAPLWGAIFGWLYGGFIRPRAPSSFDATFGDDQ